MTEFSDKFYVPESIVNKYLDHLKHLAFVKDLRSKKKKDDKNIQTKKTYEEYNWGELLITDETSPSPMIRSLDADVNSQLRSDIAITSFTQCVEELVLNSLDAEASCVAVRVNLACGRVQVVDNGRGILPEDLQRVANRYLTSKCQDVADLDNLCHYGYRGEALASIRDMCLSLEISTKHKLSPQTLLCSFKMGTFEVITDAKAPRPSSGTTISITDLFHKLPVRKKTYNDVMELERIRSNIEAIALMHPTVSFSLRNEINGNKVVQTMKTNSVVAVFGMLFGGPKSRYLKPTNYVTDKFQVNGCISVESHHNKSLQFVYINKRLVLKTRIHKLVNQLLGKSVLAKRRGDGSPKFSSSPSTSPQKYSDRHGIFILDISCPLNEYDITLDPAKTLVEFKNWPGVLRCVDTAVQEFLRRESLVTTFEIESSEQELNTEVVSLDATKIEDKVDDVGATNYGETICTTDLSNSLHSIAVRRLRQPHSLDARSPSAGAISTSDSAPVDSMQTSDSVPAVHKSSDEDCLAPGATLTVAANAIHLAHASKVANDESSKDSKLPQGTSQSPLAYLYKTTQSESPGTLKNSESESPIQKDAFDKPVASPRRCGGSSLTEMLNFTSSTNISSSEGERDKTFISLPTPTTQLSLESIRKSFSRSSDKITPEKLKPHKVQGTTPWSKIREKVKNRTKSRENQRKAERNSYPVTHINDISVNENVDQQNERQRLLGGFNKIRSKLSKDRSSSNDFRERNECNSQESLQEFSDCPTNSQDSQIDCGISRLENDNGLESVPCESKHSNFVQSDDLFLFEPIMFKNESVTVINGEQVKNVNNEYSNESNGIKTSESCHKCVPISNPNSKPASESKRKYASVHASPSWQPAGRDIHVTSYPAKLYSPLDQSVQESTYFQTNFASPVHHARSCSSNAQRNFMTTGSLVQTARDVDFEEVRRSIENSQEEEPPEPKRHRGCVFISDSDENVSPLLVKYKDLLKKLEKIKAKDLLCKTDNTDNEDMARKMIPEFSSKTEETGITTQILNKSNSGVDAALCMKTIDYDIDLIPLCDVLKSTYSTNQVMQDAFSNDASKKPSDTKANRTVHDNNSSPKYSSLCSDEKKRPFGCFDDSGIQGDLLNVPTPGCVSMAESTGFYQETAAEDSCTLQSPDVTTNTQTQKFSDPSQGYSDVTCTQPFLVRVDSDTLADATLSAKTLEEKKAIFDDSDVADDSKFGEQSELVEENTPPSIRDKVWAIPQSQHEKIVSPETGRLMDCPDESSGMTQESIPWTPLTDHVLKLMTHTVDDQEQMICADSAMVQNSSSQPQKFECVVNFPNKLLSQQTSPTLNVKVDMKLESVQDPESTSVPETDSPDSENSVVVVKSEDITENKSENSAVNNDKPRWICQMDKSGRNVYINQQTGHTSYTQPVILDDTDTKTLTLPKSHPMRRCSNSILQSFKYSNKKPSLSKSNVINLSPTSQNQLSSLLGQHRHGQDTEDHQKWGNDDYKQVMTDKRPLNIEEMFNNWSNPVITRSEKEVVNLENSGGKGPGTTVHKTLNTYKLTADMLTSVKVIGQLDKKFILCLLDVDKTGNNMLVVIDQHAAHERIRLESLVEDSYDEYEDSRQYHIMEMDPAIEMTLTSGVIRILTAYRTKFKSLGLEFSVPIDKDDVVHLQAVPRCLVQREPDQSQRGRTPIAREIIETFIKEQAGLLSTTHGANATLPQTFLRCLASQACHGAIKFGHKLSAARCTEIVTSLSECDLPFQCAHGRPSVMPLVDLQKLTKIFPTQEPKKPNLTQFLMKMRMQEVG